MKWFDLICLFSIVGIWPRFIEPKRLKTTHLHYTLKGLKKEVRLALFSDLHLSKEAPKDSLLKEIINKTASFNPHYVFSLGDFLSFGQLEDKERLSAFLEAFSPYKCYTIFGNHDYTPFLSINEEGDFDAVSEKNVFKKAIRLLLNKKKRPTLLATDAAKKACLHPELVEIIKKSPFQILENEKPIIDEARGFACVGLPEISLGKFNVQKHFSTIPKWIFPVTLIHNPDLFFELSKTCSPLVFAGHTHGGQINLPWVRDKLIVLNHPEIRSGEYPVKEKTLYVTRGLGSPVSFRLFAPPELVLITLYPEKTQSD